MLGWHSPRPHPVSEAPPLHWRHSNSLCSQTSTLEPEGEEVQSQFTSVVYLVSCDVSALVLSRRKSKAYGFGEESSSIEAAQAKVSEGLISSVFEISTPTNVPADNSGHKVRGV